MLNVSPCCAATLQIALPDVGPAGEVAVISEGYLASDHKAKGVVAIWHLPGARVVAKLKGLGVSDLVCLSMRADVDQDELAQRQ